MDFGANLREYRQKAGLTQEKLAEALSVSMQAVSRWETTDTLPDAALLPDLADALGITIDDLFGGTSRRDLPRIVARELDESGIPDVTRTVYELVVAAVKSSFGGIEDGEWWKPRWPEDGYWKKDFPDSDPPPEQMGQYIFRTGHQRASDCGWLEVFESKRFPFAAVLPEPDAEGLAELLTGEEVGTIFDSMGDPLARRCLNLLLKSTDKVWTDGALFDEAGVPDDRREDVTQKLRNLRGGYVRVWEDRIDEEDTTLIRCQSGTLLPLLLASAYACSIRWRGFRSGGGSRTKPIG